jgi:hypothetical protein
MIGKIFITSSGYDPEAGRHVHDPYLGPCPTLGACRPDIRRQLKEGDHIFVISGKVPQVNQYVMAGFEIDAKIDALEAHRMFPELRLRTRKDGQLTGNIIVNASGQQHALDNHDAFDRRIRNYVIGKNPLVLATHQEIAEGRRQTMAALCDILETRGNTPIEVVGRWGKKLTEKQILQLRDWLLSLKTASERSGRDAA